MSSILSKSSSTADVVAWLRMNNFGDEVIDKFELKVCISLFIMSRCPLCLGYSYCLSNDLFTFLNFCRFDLCSIVEEAIDGYEFYTMEMWMIERLIKGLKNIKRFKTLWSHETNMVC